MEQEEHVAPGVDVVVADKSVIERAERGPQRWDPIGCGACLVERLSIDG
ncbi:MAG: hypothetical protein ACTHJM_02215 [Marmoricola sp.]